MNEKTEKLIAGLRELADFIEERPELFDRQGLAFGTAYVFTYTADEFAECVRLLGKGQKEANDAYFNVTRRFGPIELQVTANRSAVCEKVQTGTKVVKARDPQLVHEAIKDIPQVETEEPVYEWKCPPSILSAGLDVAAAQ